MKIITLTLLALILLTGCVKQEIEKISICAENIPYKEVIDLSGIEKTKLEERGFICGSMEISQAIIGCSGYPNIIIICKKTIK